MSIKALAVTCLVAFCQSGTASALTVVNGSLSSDNSYRSTLDIGTREGISLITIETDRVADYNFSIDTEISFQYRCPGILCGEGSNSFPIGFGYSFENTNYMRFLSKINVGGYSPIADYRVASGTSLFSLTSPASGPINFVITEKFVAFVPEPSQWLMLVLGFGIVGTVARGRGKVLRLATDQAAQAN